MTWKIDRLENIERAAMRMLDEIEWVNFANPLTYELAPDFVRNDLSKFARSPIVRARMEVLLKAVFRELTPHAETLPTVHEIEQEAAGLIASAFKRALLEDAKGRNAQPQYLTTFVEASPTVVKFRSIPEPLIQAPAAVRIPSMKVQREFRDGL